MRVFFCCFFFLIFERIPHGPAAGNFFSKFFFLNYNFMENRVETRFLSFFFESKIFFFKGHATLSNHPPIERNFHLISLNFINFF